MTLRGTGDERRETKDGRRKTGDERRGTKDGGDGLPRRPVGPPRNDRGFVIPRSEATHLALVMGIRSFPGKIQSHTRWWRRRGFPQRAARDGER